MQIEIRSLVGTPGNGEWAQAFTLEVLAGEVARKLFGIITLEGYLGVEAAEAGREIIKTIEEAIQEADEQNLASSFKNAVERALSVGAKAVIGLADNESLMVAGNDGEMLLKRGEKTAQIFKSKADVHLIKGKLKAGDFWILGSTEFFQHVPKTAVADALENALPDKAEECLAPEVGKENSSGKVAAIFGKITDDPFSTEEEKPVVLDKYETTGLQIEIANQDDKEEKPQRLFLKTEGREARRKVYLVLCLTVLAAMGVACTTGLVKRRETIRENNAETLKAQAEEKYKNAKLLMTSDIEASKRVSGEARQDLDKAVLLGTKKQSEYQALADEISKFQETLGVENNFEPELFFELSLIAENASGNRMVYADGNLLIADEQNQKIYSINVEKKSKKTIENTGKVTSFFADDKGILWLGEKSIHEISKNGGKTDTLLENNSRLGEAKSLARWNDNLYVLSANEIWRFQKANGKYGSGDSWLKEGNKIEGGVGIGIDGSIWVAQKQSLRKFTLGTEETVSLTKLPESLAEVAQIILPETSNTICLLDKGVGKVITLDKSGTFLSSLVWDGLKTADSIAVENTGKTVFILKENKIYKADVKQ